MNPGQSGLIGIVVIVLPAAKLDPELVMLKFAMSIMTLRRPRRKPEFVVVQVYFNKNSETRDFMKIIDSSVL